jgi:hypothetical protein
MAQTRPESYREIRKRERTTIDTMPKAGKAPITFTLEAANPPPDKSFT